VVSTCCVRSEYLWMSEPSSRKCFQMRIQLDTSVQIHRLTHLPSDTINSQLRHLMDEASSAEVSTYAKKEFAFSMIKDCCTILARLSRRKSMQDALNFIHQYGHYKPRFIGRMMAICWLFQMGDQTYSNWKNLSLEARDRIVAEEFARFLRVYIPVLWEEFESNVSAVSDRTKCPFARQGPIDNGRTFELRSKKKCDSSLGCALAKMIAGEKDRASQVLAALKQCSAESKTLELKKIEDFLDKFIGADDPGVCFKMCNQGIGDLIIALETPLDRTLVTTNEKETRIISSAMCQDFRILGPPET